MLQMRPWFRIVSWPFRMLPIYIILAWFIVLACIGWVLDQIGRLFYVGERQ